METFIFLFFLQLPENFLLLLLDMARNIFPVYDDFNPTSPLGERMEILDSDFI